ncbi:MAG: ABC transporter substrate-binding protein [Bacteroides sp.]
MKKRWLLFGFIGLLLYACAGGKKEGAVVVPHEQLQPVRLGILPTMDGLPFVVAEKQGLYDSLGVDVTLVRFQSPYDRDAALQSGQIDGAVTDYPSVVVLQAHHTELAFIMKNDGYYCFIVSRQSKINRQKQLTNKNIAVSRNTMVEYATYLFLDKIKISPTEVNLPEIGQLPLRLQMLSYGQVDASFLPDPFATIAMGSGQKSLVSTRELGISWLGTAFTLKALKEKREEIKLLVKGYNWGVNYLQTHPQKQWKKLLMEETGIPEALTGLIVLPTYQLATRPSEKELANAVAWLKTKKRIPSAYRGENLVDTTFVSFE